MCNSALGWWESVSFQCCTLLWPTASFKGGPTHQASQLTNVCCPNICRDTYFCPV